MPTVAIDTYKLRTALKSTGKSANFTADEIANAIDRSQDDADLLTTTAFEARMAGVDARIAGVEARIAGVDARMTVFDAKLDVIRAEIRSEVKAGQVQNLLWLSGIMLASNGAVIAVLARAARLL